ncbi:MAG: hypothetical protein K2N92_02295, partial [Malacoplasma sp.]|nr:hypothetical protein [Malacoplasma sp.]
MSNKSDSIYKQVKSSNFKRKYLKIIKFLVSKNISSDDIEYQREIHTKDGSNLNSLFSCFYP